MGWRDAGTVARCCATDPPPVPAEPRALILQPRDNDGPSRLASWLREQGIAFDLVQVDAGDPVPLQAAPWAALAVLGGDMSANDPLPWLARADALLRDAVALGVPVLGHCLGGQLLARALGARVVDNPEPEIGWARIRRSEHPLARAWLGDAPELTVYQWHFQTFELPPGATLLAGNAACAHQAFAWGPHLGLQFHIEVDAEKLALWDLDAPPDGHPLRAHAGVQGLDALRAGHARHLARSLACADRLYARWWSQARR